MIEAKRRVEELDKINAWKDPVSRRKWLNVAVPAAISSTRNAFKNGFGGGRKKVGKRNRFG
jgi:hypothetical protein